MLCMSLGPGDALASEAVLNNTLVLARKSVGEFWDHFRSVTCVEQVTQEKFGKEGKREHKQEATFDYLVLMNVEKNGLSVEESRLQKSRKQKTKNVPLMISTGLPTLLLAFHPYYRDAFRYELASDEPVTGDGLIRIRFKHIPGTQSTTALRLRGKDYALDVEGTAWVDSGTGAIQRISAGIAGPLSDLNLKALEMDVSYSPHDFQSGEGIYWLPSTAVVEIRTERQRWRNHHQYSGYKRFSVNTEDKISR